MALRKAVFEYDVMYKNNETILYYYLDNNKGMRFAHSASMTLKLSNDFSIISKEPNYSSEKEYVNETKKLIYQSCLSNGFAAVVLIVPLSYFGLVCIANRPISRKIEIFHKDNGGIAPIIFLNNKKFL